MKELKILTVVMSLICHNSFAQHWNDESGTNNIWRINGIGLGLTSPENYKLAIYNRMALQGSSSYVDFKNNLSDENLFFRINHSQNNRIVIGFMESNTYKEYLNIRKDGRIGIGMSPAWGDVGKLCVDGNIRLQGNSDRSILLGSEENSNMSITRDAYSMGIYHDFGLNGEAKKPIVKFWDHGSGIKVYQNIEFEKSDLIFSDEQDDFMKIKRDQYSLSFVDKNGSSMLKLWEHGGGLKIYQNVDIDAGRLRIDGLIIAKEIQVKADVWADFVFEKEYDLPSLSEVEIQISETGHLKGIPSAKEVEENGFSLGEMDSKLLQKIEELTLYMIDVNKRVNELETENRELKEKVNRLENE